MFKKIFWFYFFLNLLICNTSFKSEAFNKYSTQSIGYQNSIYSISLTKPIDAPISYHFNWIPTLNVIINMKLMNNFKNDNKLFHSFNFGFLFKNNIIGMSINSLKFDNEFNNIRWDSYFLINKIDFKNWFIQTMLSYNFNSDFYFFSISNYFEKSIYKNININFGFNLTQINDILIIPYLGIRYNL